MTTQKTKISSYKHIFDSSSDAIMLLDKKGFFDCNPATLKVFGLSKKSEFVGIHPSKLSPPAQPDGQDSLKLASKNIETAFKKGFNQFEWVHKRKNGQDFPAHVSLTAFDFEGRRVLQATVRDTTVQKQNEAKFRETLEQAEKINNLMVGRELKMIELKEKIKQLQSKT